MRRRIGFLKKQYLLLGLLVSVAAFVGMAAPKVSAADCDDNAIIYCGFSASGSGTNHVTARENFIKTVRSNDSGGPTPHHDLIAVYKAYNLDSTQYDRFVSYAKQGVTTRSGDIIVNDQVVATNGNSIGRLERYQGSHPFSKTIGNTTYWGNVNSQAFKAGTDSIPVTVLFDTKGVPIFAVMNSCGNPMDFTPVHPTYSCTNLDANPVSGQPGKFSFKTNARAAHGAIITQLVYHFGDGSEYVSHDVNQVVYHTYTKSDNYKATVTVSIALPGGNTDTIVGADTGCWTMVKVALPFYQCLQLTVTAVPDQKNTYQFIAKGTFQNGATLTGANFTFGDGKTVSNIGRSTSSTVTTTHQYGQDGKYNASATMLVKLPNGTVTTTNPCPATVKVAAYGCIQLTGELLQPLSYRFVVTANATQGAKLNSIDFNFGDNNTANGVKPTNLTATIDHTYAANGDYTITAVLHFQVGKLVKDDTCTATVSKTVTPECQPGIPQGSSLCSCQYNPSVPANSSQCVLPNTGAGDVIGIAGVTAIVGFFIYRQFIYRKHRFHTNNGTLNRLLGEEPSAADHTDKAVELHKAIHERNHQPLSHATYHRPHRFRPRSHGDHHEQ